MHLNMKLSANVIVSATKRNKTKTATMVRQLQWLEGDMETNKNHTIAPSSAIAVAMHRTANYQHLITL